MDVKELIYQRARAANATIAIADSEDERVTNAIKIIEREKLAQLTLLNSHSFQNLPPKEQDELVDIVHKTATNNRPPLESTGSIQHVLASDTKYLAAALVKAGKVDGYVAGNMCTTAETIRPALRVIGTAGGYASSFFIMLYEGKSLFFADCAFNPAPKPEELARIAVDTARHAQELGVEPHVAFLSFSTAGSAQHEYVDKTRGAIRHARSMAPDISIAKHELQFDAAFNADVAAKKVSGDPVAGTANVFIFPDINSGNIGYKIARGLGGAQAIGPIFQGLNAPVNDLSRSCSIQDIVDVVAVTAMQAGTAKRKGVKK